jgi:DHA1 family inner membrane transport protein
VTASLLALFLFGANPALAAAAIVGVGLFGMGMAPSLQHRVVNLAGPGAPLAASLPASAVNAGIALGAIAGGVTIDGAGVPAVAITGAIVGGASILLALATSMLRPATAPQSTATTQLR